MNKYEHKYLQLDHVEADLIVGPVKVLLLAVALLGIVFYSGFRVGGLIEFPKGRLAGMDVCREDMDTAIKEGKEFVFPEGKGTVRYQLRAIYEDPTTSF